MRRLAVAPLALCAAAVAFDFLAPHTSARLLLGLARAQAGLEAARVRVADVDIAYLAGGAGEPLILIHGFGADKDNFTLVAAYLTPHYRILVPDLPGFGDSSKSPSAGYTIAQQVENVRAFARALGIERVHLGGNSMGGFIATEYAVTYPDEVASLWLLGPAGTRIAFDSELTHAIESGRNPLLPTTPEDFARTIDFVMTRKPFMPHSIKYVLAERAAADYALQARIFEDIGPRNMVAVDERLPGLATPALVVFGTEDRALNPKAAATYAAAMPNAQVLLMEGVGHVPMVESPAQAAAAYLRFRTDLAARHG